jgi:hypothetical protein
MISLWVGGGSNFSEPFASYVKPTYLKPLTHSERKLAPLTHFHFPDYLYLSLNWTDDELL